MSLRIWDTCSYVRRFRERHIDDLIVEDIRRRRFLLCSVVAMELYAGSRDAGAKRGLDDLIRHLASLDLLIAPAFDDFQRVGIALNRYARQRGKVDTRSHFRDALIAACANRREAIIVTENIRDLRRWSRWLRPGRAQQVLTPELSPG